MIRTEPATLTLFADTVVAPARAFAAHVRTPRFGVLLAVLLAATLGFHVFYFMRLDYAWFADHVYTTLPEPLRRQLPYPLPMSRTSVFLPAVVSATLKPLLLIAGMAAYLAVVGRVRGIELGFARWFNVAAWIGLPYLLLVPMECVETWRHASGQVALEDVDPTSLNALLFHLDAGAGGYALATSVSLATFWSAALCATAVRQAMDCGRTAAAAIVVPIYLASLAPALAMALL